MRKENNVVFLNKKDLTENKKAHRLYADSSDPLQQIRHNMRLWERRTNRLKAERKAIISQHNNSMSTTSQRIDSGIERINDLMSLLREVNKNDKTKF
jgi:hypothetical protein